MSAEHRAKSIVEECRAYDSAGDLLFIACDRAEAIIASAIREAQASARNEALERTATVFEALPDQIVLTPEQSAWAIRDMIDNPPDWDAPPIHNLKTKD